MANNIATNTWHIDTPSASAVKPTTTTQNGPFNIGGATVFVSALEFNGYASATDQAIVSATDTAGNTFNVFVAQGKPDLSPVSTNFGKGIWIRSLTVPVLSSGFLTVYLG